MPIHMADIGSDNFEQEFTLSLMENEGGGPAEDRGLAGADRGRQLRRVRRVRGEDPQEPPERHPLRHALRQVRVRAGDKT